MMMNTTAENETMIFLVGVLSHCVKFLEKSETLKSENSLECADQISLFQMAKTFYAVFREPILFQINDQGEFRQCKEITIWQRYIWQFSSLSLSLYLSHFFSVIRHHHTSSFPSMAIKRRHSLLRLGGVFVSPVKISSNFTSRECLFFSITTFVD
jgi:hypothetical protein